ncbi:hypothetical protein [Otariodibacter oris]|uniref:Uncharacterized protein n=1 Tax=Otariodibacter oris TaxID=1032623 RepID=A0A420XFS8_9PAST|nr:hypothetical protein [Otariodibacter oris]RKR71658.1 hypothetical protein DES31_1393 [Otariodibacter oris]
MSKILVSVINIRFTFSCYINRCVVILMGDVKKVGVALNKKADHRSALEM